MTDKEQLLFCKAAQESCPSAALPCQKLETWLKLGPAQQLRMGVRRFPSGDCSRIMLKKKLNRSSEQQTT